MRLSKDTTINVSVSTIVSVVGSIAAMWAFAAPIAQRAMAGEIKDQIAPLSDAFQVLLIQQIQNQRNSITAMEFKRDMCSGVADCWTLRDAQDLDAARNTLSAMQMALATMQKR
jgi:hypothetical protein